LAELRRFTLGTRRSRHAGDRGFVRLRFARSTTTIACGLNTPDYGRFVSALAAAGAQAAPDARFHAQGGWLAGVVTMAAALLSAGAAALTLSSMMAGFEPLGLDLASRLVFLLILVFALTPWIGRRGRRSLDPNALPPTLLRSPGVRFAGRSPSVPW